MTRIAVASGKGGTGKTTVATNLVVQAARSGEPVVYGDCDVEEPNGHLFLQPEIINSVPFSLEIPAVVKERCTGCGRECAGGRWGRYWRQGRSCGWRFGGGRCGRFDPEPFARGKLCRRACPENPEQGIDHQ